MVYMRIFVKAQCSALIATITDFAITVLLGKVMAVYYVVSVAVGAISGGCLNFYINQHHVFTCEKGQAVCSQVFRYFGVWIVSIGLNTIGTYCLTESTRMDFILSKIVVAIFVAIVWNYEMQKHFVFKILER